VRGSLWVGDYSIHGHETRFAVERKSLADFIGCVPGSGLEFDSVRRLEKNQAGESDKGGNRARFERELFVLRTFEFARLLIVGTTGYQGLFDYVATGRSHSRINPLSVVNTLRAFDARYIPVVFALTPDDAAIMVEDWATWFVHSWESSNKRYEIRKKQDGKRMDSKQSDEQV
jgi:hypothetical protein